MRYFYAIVLFLLPSIAFGACADNDYPCHVKEIVVFQSTAPARAYQEGFMGFMIHNAVDYAVVGSTSQFADAKQLALDLYRLDTGDQRPVNNHLKNHIKWWVEQRYPGAGDLLSQ